MSEISKEKIKQALDKFEEDDFVSSKDILARELKKKINDYLKDKTKVEKDPIEVKDDDNQDGDGDTGDTDGDGDTVDVGDKE